jgi:hypothetical protein
VIRPESSVSRIRGKQLPEQLGGTRGAQACPAEVLRFQAAQGVFSLARAQLLKKDGKPSAHRAFSRLEPNLGLRRMPGALPGGGKRAEPGLW